MFSGYSKNSTIPSGNLAKASSVGVNTVSGPSPFKASTNPVTFAAAIKVLKLPALDAKSTISYFLCEIENAVAVTKKLAIASVNNFLIFILID